MNSVLSLIETRIIQVWRCRRCSSKLFGVIGARYCSNCLWDELEDTSKNHDCKHHKQIELKRAA